MKVLVTGASGHIGGAIAGALREAGHAVIAAVRGEAVGAQVHSSNVRFDLLDRSFPSILAREARGCESIVHAAAVMVHEFGAIDGTRANCEGTHALLNLASELGNIPFVFISGVAVLGDFIERRITESHPVAPKSPYTASKLYGEHLVRLYSERGAVGTSLRVPSPVGPGLRKRRIFSIFVDAALKNAPIKVSDADRPQDYVDVRDIAEAANSVLAQRASGVFNIASGRTTTNLELARKIVSVLNSSSPIEVTGERGDALEQWTISIDAAAKALGYAPRYPLEDSIRAFAEELRARG